LHALLLIEFRCKFHCVAECTAKRRVNVAVYKPTSQSSALFHPVVDKVLSAALVVDGDVDSALLDGSCMLTNESDDNPWVAVDLGRATIVTGVSITNAGKDCGERSYS